MSRKLMIKPTCPAPKKVDIPPSDRGNDVSIKFKKGKISSEELYDEYCAAGLSPEEADEMCNLMEDGD